jgi:hypothetical protein
MPSIEITDEQYERLAALREELAATHAGEYASVQPADAMAYLLDLAEAADDTTDVFDDESEIHTDTPVAADDQRATNGDKHTDATSVDGADMPGDDDASGAPGDGIGMLNLLEDHDEKWREADGDARYEVDLPDGGTKTARTRDDVKAVLFKHYR